MVDLYPNLLDVPFHIVVNFNIHAVICWKHGVFTNTIQKDKCSWWWLYNSFCSEFSATTDFAGSRSIVRTALIIVSILAAVSMLLLLIVASYVCKKSRKPHMHVQLASDGKFAETLLAYTRILCCNLQTWLSIFLVSPGHGDEEEIRSSEPLMYDLSTLRAATDNFSEENKLGEGGFGPVYKVTF